MPLIAHFINVGQGDCTIVELPSGRVAMIDIDNLKVLDPDTRKGLLDEYRESFEYVGRQAISPASATDLEREFLRKHEEQLTDPLAYYDAHIGQYKDIFRFIVTHPDMDHMTGLYRLHQQDAGKSIVNFWHTGFNDFNLSRHDSRGVGNLPV